MMLSVLDSVCMLITQLVPCFNGISKKIEIFKLAVVLINAFSCGELW